MKRICSSVGLWDRNKGFNFYFRTPTNEFIHKKSKCAMASYANAGLSTNINLAVIAGFMVAAELEKVVR